MSAKVTKVLLTNSVGSTKAFEYSHAERLLARHNTRWCVAEEEKKFEWDGKILKQRVHRSAVKESK